MKVTEGKINLGHFWYTNVWCPGTPALLLLPNESLGKGKGKVLGRSPNSSVTVIPTCPSQHPFRLAGSQTP